MAQYRDEIDQYLDEIEGGTTPQQPQTTSQTANVDPGRNTTLQAVLGVNGRVTGITPLPQGEQDSLAAILGGTPKEQIVRYWFENGKYVDVGSSSSNVYRGTAMSSAKTKPSPVDDLVQVNDPRTGQPVKLRDPMTGQLIDLPDNISNKPNIVTRGNTAYQVGQDANGQATFTPVMTFPSEPSEPNASMLDLLWRQQRYPDEKAEDLRRWEAAQQWDRDERGIIEGGLTDRNTADNEATWKRNEASLANSRTMQQMQDDAAMLRQKLSTAGTMSDSIARNTLAAQQYAMDPSWNGIAPGFEANGAYGQLLKFAGAQPRDVRLPQIQFDPLEAWRLAQQATGAR